MIKSLSILFCLLFLGLVNVKAFPVKSDTILIYPVKIYLRYVATANTKPELAISYDMQYPFFFKEKIFVPDLVYSPGRIIRLHTKSLHFFLNTKGIMVSPGDTVEFTTNLEGKVQLTGKNEKYQNYPYYSLTGFYQSNKNPQQWAQDTSAGIQTYKAYCLKYYNKEQQYITDYFAKSRESALEKYLLEESKYSMISNLCELPAGYQNNKNQIPANYLSREYIELFNHPPAYFGPYFRIALLEYNTYLAGDVKGTREEKVKQLIDSAKRNFSLPTYYYLLVLRFKRITEFGNASYSGLAANLYNQLKGCSLSTGTLASIKNYYENFLILAKNIKDFGNIKVKNSQGQIVNMKEIIKTGKPNFIDFWATWCAACIKEFPYLDSIKKNHPEINYISLSVDEDEEKWKNYVTKQERETDNSFLLTNAMNNKLVRDYNIKEYPRFILFDKDGNCVSGDFIRPSDNDFINQLNELLNKH